MSTNLVKKQLHALTAAPEQQQQQTKAVKKQLQKQRKLKAAEAKALADRAPAKIKSRNLKYFKKTAAPDEKTQELMSKVLALTSRK